LLEIRRIVGGLDSMRFLAARHSSFSALAVLALLSCREPTQVIVELSTDIRCSDQPRTGISVGALSELESRPMSTETLRCDPATGRIGSIVVVPDRNQDSEFAIRIVTGMTMSPDDCVRSGYLGGCVVARRVLGFIPHETLDLPIRMEASCLDVPCGKTETCRSGSCVSATIPNPQECTQPAGCDLPSSGGRGGSGGSSGMTNAAGGGGAGGASAGNAAGASGNLGSGGTSASGGTTGTTAGASSTSFTPACTTTAGGIGIYKGLACTAADPQLCYWPCGPLETGHRSETCTSGTYAESGCQFPTGVDYSCFKVPQVDSAQCPTTAPQSGQPCSLATCSLPCTGTACETCGLATGYRDTLGASKVGYCVCAAGTGGNRWSCASTQSWPCPAGQGCG
jgi:hypothetical protein